MSGGPIYSVPIARKVGSGLECPTCKRVLHHSDDKSTGWASRAYYAHFVKEHDPPDLNAGVDFWAGDRTVPPQPFVSWQQVITLARKQLETMAGETP